MTPRAPRHLLVASAALVAGAAVALACGSAADAPRRARQESLQRALGGLGLGPALDLHDGAATYDPRLGGRAHGGAAIVAPGSASR